MTQARRALVVAYKFPPIGGIGSVRLARFATYLPEFGWEPTVLAPRDTPHVRDSELHFPESKVVRSRSIEFSGVGRAVAGSSGDRVEVGSPSARRELRDRLRALAHKYVLYPDPQVGWYPGAVTAGLRALRRERFDVIFSSSHPVTTHFVAWTLSRATGLPWLAEFRDPWSAQLAVDHPHRRRAERHEQAIASRAAAMAMPTPTMVEHYSQVWGREIVLLPNGHDAAIPPGERPRHATLTHVGTYHPGRQSFRTLWAALEDLLRTNPADVPRIRFVGELPKPLRDELAAFGLGHLVEATGFLPHREAMQKMASSSLLIASGFTGSRWIDRAVIPAKLFEYLASDLPILFFGTPGDDGGQLLDSQPGCYLVNHSDASGARDALLRALEEPRTYRRDVQHFSRRERTRVLARTLDEAAA